MSERTGATDAQIELAAMRADESWEYGEGMPHVLGPEVRAAAKFLVPPGMVIARTADILTTEQRAELMELIEGYGDEKQRFGFAAARNDGDQVALASLAIDDHLESISAKLNGGTE